MKSRFTTVDIIAIIKEINLHYVGHRAIQIYDIDNKTFLIKLSKSGEEGKTMLLIESGIRIHITEFEWPKNPSPSGFSMKLRKHIKNRRLESINQLGSDRIIDLQFGTKECAFHLIVELYDRGNLVLTDHEYMILHLVRPRVDNNQELKFYAKERYHIESAKTLDYISEINHYHSLLTEALTTAKPSDNIRKILSSVFAYGPNLLEHCAVKHGYTANMKLSQCLKNETNSEIIEKLCWILKDAQNFIDQFKSMETHGFIYGKSKEGDPANEIIIYEEFHPFEFAQLENKPHKEIATFNQAVDEFFSSLESQKFDMQVNQKEKAALKKLENIKLDHERRLKELKDAQEEDMIKAEMIQLNSDLVNRAVLILNHAVANQVSWEDIREMVRNGQEIGDPIALAIQEINFESNQMVLKLENPYDTDGDDNSVNCAINLGMNAFTNARKYFTMKKAAGHKEIKTISASEKALKSAEVHTKQLLNEVQTVAKINKMRKVNWFEKFNWFISSENYLVVGGKDQQQNEFLVKRYFRPGDIYVHADIHGASTVIIKNHEYPACVDIPPKTLTEAGHMAVIYSSAWDSKISTSAWWVRHDQVSKTAPTGEYLTTGSFMVRGKKNYLLASLLTFGFGILFKVTDDSIVNHINDRRVRDCEQDSIDTTTVSSELDDLEEVPEESSDSESDTDTNEAFPNTKILINLSEDLKNTPKNNVEQEEKALRSGGQHRHLSAKERRDLKKYGGKTNMCGGKPGLNEEEKSNGKDDLKEKKIDNVENDESKDSDNEPEDSKPNETEEASNGCTESVKEARGRPEDGPLKRGQRNKLKKMKTKYKDQDDEDREMMMAILKGKNPYQESEVLKPLTTKQKRKLAEEQKKKLNEEKKIQQQQKFQEKQQKAYERQKKEVVEIHHEDDYEESVEDHPVREDSHKIISSLTGNPLPEDELIYALPVLAPYQTLQNYKYKVKMVPGNTKRGKAGKTILYNFMMDKSITSREKDLMKALKDQDITRNFPRKVKIYMPNLVKGNKKNFKS